MSRSVIFNDNNAPVSITSESSRSRASVLGRLIEIIALGSDKKRNLKRDPAEIEVKIDFNSLASYRWLVDSYIENSLLVDDSVIELNRVIANGSTKLKRQMNRFYYESLAKFRIPTKPVDILLLRKNADFIVEDVMDRAAAFVKKSNDLGDGYYDEDISWGIELITSYSIIECIVLENPNDHN